MTIGFGGQENVYPPLVFMTESDTVLNKVATEGWPVINFGMSDFRCVSEIFCPYWDVAGCC